MRHLNRIRVDGVTVAADRLRQYLGQAGYRLVERCPSLTITLDDGPLALDSVDSPLEARILANLQELTPAPVLLKRAGGNQDPDAAAITAPEELEDAVARAVFRAIEQVAVVPRPWWALWVVLLLCGLPAQAQEQPPFQQLDANTGATTNPRVFMGLFAPSSSGAVAVALPTALGANGGFGVDILNPTLAVTGTFWQATQPVSQSGTWTVQPGNTANTTAWLVTGTGGTFPVTGTFWQATQPISGTVTIGTFPDNEPINIAQLGGTAIYVDPCQQEARTVYVVDIVTATTTEIANQVASEFFYVCSISIFSAGINNVALVEDDSDTCATPTAGLNGGVTAAEGYNFIANQGIVVGTGQAWVMKTGTANRYFCIITSAAVQLSGTITYVSAP